MAITSIKRCRGINGGHDVPLSGIVVTDIRQFEARQCEPRWRRAIAKYYVELNLLLAAIRLDLPLPRKFFVPDLYDIGRYMDAAVRQEFWDVWALGSDLAEAAGYRRDYCDDSEVQEDVGGSMFHMSSQSTCPTG